MAKVQVHDKPQDTPSQQIVKKAGEVFIVKDENGREIGIKNMNAMTKDTMFEVLGGTNQESMGYRALVFYVVSIDGEPVQIPRTVPQVKAIIQRLENPGIDAISSGIIEHFYVDKVVGVADIKNS